MVCSAIVVCLLAGGVFDAVANWGKIYPGVSVGTIDVGGMTRDEATRAITDAYQEKLDQTTVIVYASDEAAQKVRTAEEEASERSTAEQRSVEEGRAAKELWTTSASELGASLPAQKLADEALAQGRSEGGILARIGAVFMGRAIDVRADFDSAAFEALASDIDLTIGKPRVDWGIAVEDGQAHTTEGSDGVLVDRSEFEGQLDGAFFGDDSSFVAMARPAPMRIDETQASAAADAVNGALSQGFSFSYEGSSWSRSASDVGSWVTTCVEAESEEGSFALDVRLDESRAKPSILADAERESTGEGWSVAFERAEDGSIAVRPQGAVQVPCAADAVSALDAYLFSGYREGAGLAQAASSTSSGARVSTASDGGLLVEIGARDVDDSLSFDEALDGGVIGEISSYTTEYLNTAGTENRRHNIHLVSDFLDGSVAKANGGTWSFNDVAGNCNAERGFLGAGAILDGEMTDAVGGGICQVATTVFNAVYDSGLPVLRRSNHSLFIASYPVGRDAAVSWPDLDFVWQNDTASDVLLRATYTDTSITVTLYGVDPGYQVSTQVGDWSAGKKHATRTERDSSMRAGTSYVKTAGADGAIINVYRTVKSSSGVLLREDVFHSEYDPVTEVIVAGPEVASSGESSSSSSQSDSSSTGALSGDSASSE